MNMRISGLASGMDIEQLVRDLMKVERVPLDKYKQKKQTLEWQRDIYREMNSLLLSLRESTLNMRLSSSYRAKSVASTNDSLVSAIASTGASNITYTIQKVEKLATAARRINTGQISASQSDKVDLSKGLYNQKDKFSNSNFDWKIGGLKKDSISVTASQDFVNLSELSSNIKTDAESLQNMEVVVNGKRYEVVTGVNQTDLEDSQVLLDTSGTNGKLVFKNPLSQNSSVTINYFVNQLSQEIKVPKDGSDQFQLSSRSIVQGSLSISVTDPNGIITSYTVVDSEDQLDPNQNVVFVNQESGKLKFSKTLEENSEIHASYQQNYFSFGLQTFNETGNPIKDIFSFDGSTSLNSVIAEINKSDVGVNMFYDSFTDQLTLTRSKTGDFNKDIDTDGDGNPDIRNDEIITTGSFINDVLKFGGSTETGGTNAKFTINGLETERHSNTFTIDGVNFTLKGTFDSITSTDSPVTVSITTDVNKVYDNIKAFIDKYNETIAKIHEKLLEKRYRDYPPLTDEQRTAMDEKQIELWEEKAKSGLIRNDAILSSGLNKLRMDVYSSVNNDEIAEGFRHLSAIGITTSNDYLLRGKLEINETKLKEAIEKDPDSVFKLFAASGENESQQGIAQRMANSLQKTMDKLYARAGRSYWTEEQYTLGKDLKSIDNQIERFENRLQMIESRYWRQFTAMEQAIQRANSQATYLMQQFSGGSY